MVVVTAMIAFSRMLVMVLVFAVVVHGVSVWLGGLSCATGNALVVDPCQAGSSEPPQNEREHESDQGVFDRDIIPKDHVHIESVQQAVEQDLRCALACQRHHYHTADVEQCSGGSERGPELFDVQLSHLLLSFIIPPLSDPFCRQDTSLLLHTSSLLRTSWGIGK